MLTTWEGDNVKGSGDRTTAGTVRADGRGVQGPEGEHRQPRKEDRQHQKTGGGGGGREGSAESLVAELECSTC